MAPAGFFATPLWRALLPMSFSVMCFGMNGAIYTSLATRQLGEDVYKAINIADVVASMITFAVSGVIGELSQPKRLGRKGMVLFLSIVEAVPIAALHITHDYVLFLKLRMGMSFVGISRATEGLSMQPVVASWITDWATEEQKLSVFSLLTGGIFVFYAIGPLVSGVLMQSGMATMDHILFVTLVIRLLQPLVVFFIFPSDAETKALGKQQRQLSQKEKKSVTDSGLSTPADARAFSREISTGMETLQTASDLSGVQCRAWMYLLGQHTEVVCVSLLLTLVGKAFIKNFPIFISKELGFETYYVFYLVGSACSVSILTQIVAVPRMNRRFKPSPFLMLLVCTMAQIMHMAVLAEATNPWWYWATIFLPGVIITADPVVQTAVATSGEAGGISQGAKQGALSGMRIAAACFGPLAYTMVEAAHPKGARAAWVAQGVILLPAVAVLLRVLLRPYFNRQRDPAAWTAGYRQ
jgi:hypothetical protein